VSDELADPISSPERLLDDDDDGSALLGCCVFLLNLEVANLV